MALYLSFIVAAEYRDRQQFISGEEKYEHSGMGDGLLYHNQQGSFNSRTQQQPLEENDG